MNQSQPGILLAVPAQASYLNFKMSPKVDLQTVVTCLKSIDIGNTVVGLGQSVLQQLDISIDGMKAMPEWQSGNIKTPSNDVDLWCWLRGDDRGELLHRARKICRQLSPAFTFSASLDAFQYAEGRDITGYIDGTENPQDEDAVEAAIVSGDNSALAGSSFVAVQRWQHDLDQFESFNREHQDNIIGRHLEDNEEFDEAPASAHVKRTAQESFTPEAFMLRRSMPWSKDLESGLIFVAFAHSFYAFEAQLGRMLGNEDGVTDSLFEFSQIIEGSYFWCPPVADGCLMLAALES